MHVQRNYADAQKMAAVTATHLRPIFNADYLKTAHGKHESKRRFLHQLETCEKNFIKLSSWNNITSKNTTLYSKMITCWCILLRYNENAKMLIH